MENRLQKLAILADTGTFTQAAAELHISQPALSTAIHKLERELQTPLFIRGSHPIKLTPAGKLAYNTARELAINTGNLRVRLAELATANIPLRIGMIDSIAGSVFSKQRGLDILGTDIILSVMVDNSRVLIAAIEQDELDIAFITGEPRSSTNIHIHSLGTEPLVAVCAQAQRVHTEAAIKSGLLPKFISYDQRSTTFQLVQESLHRQNIITRPAVYSTSPEVTLQLVRSQQGVAILPYGMVAQYILSKELSLVGASTIGIIARRISTAQRRDKVVPTPTTRLTRQVRRTLLDTAEAAEMARSSVRV